MQPIYFCVVSQWLVVPFTRTLMVVSVEISRSGHVERSWEILPSRGKTDHRKHLKFKSLEAMILNVTLWARECIDDRWRHFATTKDVGASSTGVTSPMTVRFSLHRRPYPQPWKLCGCTQHGVVSEETNFLSPRVSMSRWLDPSTLSSENTAQGA